MSIPVPIEGFGGGGGASLNFDVRAYATEAELLAATPKENTIGIVTTTAISGWIIDANQPEGLTAGMVWISVGTSSAIEFNVLKKNAIQVYPQTAKQYVNGALVKVDAMIYQGEWIEFPSAKKYLYKTGDQCTALTGGWTTGFLPDDYGYGEGTMTTTGSKLTVTAANVAFVASRTKNKINLSDANTLSFVITTATIPSGAAAYLCVFKDDSHFGDDNAVAKKELSNNKTGVFSVDVSSLSSSYYIGFSIAADDGQGTVSASEVYME